MPTDSRDGATARPCMQCGAPATVEVPIASGSFELHCGICISRMLGESQELMVAANAKLADHSQLVEKVRGLAAEFDEQAKKLRKDSAYTDCAVTFEYCRDALLRALGDDGK